ncbi:MAG: hypothetical protein AB7S71_16740 [Dongiaceae bacterium]
MRWLGLLLMLLLPADAAVAESVTERTAAVQAEVEAALKRLAALDPSFGFAYGAIDVVPEGAAYGVAVADVSIRLAANDPGYLDLGIVSFRLTPEAGDLYRIDRLTTPARIPHRGADGRIDGVWELDNRQLSGLWSRHRGGFLRRGAVVDLGLAITGLDVAMQAIAAAPPQAGSNLRWMELVLFRGFARREVTASGGIVDRYDLKVTPEGPVAVNGRSLDLSPAVLSMP